MLKNSIFAFMLLFVTACTSLGPKFQPAEINKKDVSILYVYRPAKFAASAGKPDLLINNELNGVVPNGSYQAIPLKKGSYQIVAKGSQYNFGPTEINTVPGKDYYLRVDLTMNAEFKKTAGAISYVGSEFYANDNETKNLLKHLNTDVQKNVQNPAFIFVRKDFALSEIQDTNLYEFKK